MTNGPSTPPADARKPLERMHRALPPLLVTVGFAALVGAGKLDALSILLVTSAILARLWMEARRIRWQLGPRQSTALSVAYIVFYVVDFLLLSGNFVTATVHLVLFGMCVKLHSMTRERDGAYLAVLSFLEMLAAAALTVDLAYMISLGFYMLLAILTLMTMEMRRSAAASDEATQWRGARRRASRLLGATALLSAGGIFLFGALIFFLLPRLSYGYLGKLTQANSYASGYGDTVSLGATGRIELNSQIVAHVRIDGDAQGSRQLRLRGAVMSSFDGKRWSSPLRNAEIFVAHGQAPFAIEARASQHSREMIAHPDTPREMIRYSVMMEPIGSDVLFLLDQPISLSGRFREVAIDIDNSVRLSGGERMAAQYEGVSAAPAAIKAPTLDGAATPSGLPRRYLQLPPLDARIAQLAAAIAPAGLSPEEKAQRLTQYLNTHYAYTLELPDKDLEDPLANFLFERKQGHCEYFASALAVMLRSVGVPSRVVTGFAGGEFNDVNHAYILRSRDAHAWVEAWLPGRGWTGLDATPAAASPSAPAGWRRSALYMDALREYWREWIVNYDVSHQQTLAADGAARARGGFDRLRLWLLRRIDAMQSWARGANARIAGAPRRYALTTLLLCLLTALLWRAPYLWRRARELSFALHPEQRPRQAATLWLARAEAELRRRGVRREKHVSAESMARRIADPELRRATHDFVRSYEAARFGASAEAAERLPELHARLRRLCRARNKQ